MDNRRTQTELQNLLNELIYDYYPSNQSDRNFIYRRNSYENDSMLQVIRELMQSHSENMREYATNMRTSLQIMEIMLRHQERQQPSTTPRTQAQSRTNSRRQTAPQYDPRWWSPQTNSRAAQLYSYVLYPFRDLSGNAIPQFQDVVIHATQEQIDVATRTYNYNSRQNPINARCPISLENFEDGDQVREIVQCGHLFCEESFQNWFRSNVRCPVCRYDIRGITTSVPDPSGIQQPINIEDEINNITSNMISGLTRNISNIINNYVNNDSENDLNLTYTFDIPIIYNDISGNHREI